MAAEAWRGTAGMAPKGGFRAFRPSPPYVACPAIFAACRTPVARLPPFAYSFTMDKTLWGMKMKKGISTLVVLLLVIASPVAIVAFDELTNAPGATLVQTAVLIN